MNTLHSFQMKWKWSAEIETRFQEKLSDDLARTYVPVFLVMIPFFATFVVVDILIQPPAIRNTVFAIRIVALTLLIYGAVQIHKFKRYTLVPWILIAATGGCMSLIASVTDGYKSPYYFGISLLILSMSQIFPWGPKKLGRWVLSLGTFYLLSVLISDHFIFDIKIFINVVAFIYGCSVISISGAWIADRLRREAFQRLLEAESEQLLNTRITQALEARNEFISIASHELKTPLTTLNFQFWLLNQQLQQIDLGSKADTIQNYMNRNQRQLKRLLRLIEDMLDLSRITTGHIQLQPELIQLNTLVQEAVETFAQQFASAGITYKLEQDQEISGYWDRVRLEQVLNNLFLNAIKYAPQSPLEVRVLDRFENVIIEIEDHGPGVNKMHREKIFERFERGGADVNSAGLGLGLYISKQIILHHGGEILVTESKGHGACFRITLPKKPVASNSISADPRLADLKA